MSDVTLERDRWMRRLGPLYPGLVALTSLTSVPLPAGLWPSDEDRLRAAPWFPAVGAAVGVALAIIAQLLLWWRVPAALAALLVQGAAVGMVGTSTLGGTAWTARELSLADGKSSADPDYWLPGMLAIIGVLAVRSAALMAIATDDWFAALLYSEVMVCFSALFLQYIGDTSAPPESPVRTPMAVGPITLPALGMGSAIAAGCTLLVLVWSGVVALVATLFAVALAFALGLLIRRRLGRLPSPSLGAIACACGVLVLIAFAAAHPTSVSPWVR